MSITFNLSSGLTITFGHYTLETRHLKAYAMMTCCLKKIEAYGLSSDLLKNDRQYCYETIFNFPRIKILSSSNIAEIKVFVNELNDKFNDDLDYRDEVEDSFKNVLNMIEPEVKRQYIIAKVNEARERNIPDPPVDISNDPVE